MDFFSFTLSELRPTQKEKEKREKERRREEAEGRQLKGEGKGDKGKAKSRSVGNYTTTSEDYSNLPGNIKRERQRLISRFHYHQGYWHKEITNRMDTFNDTALDSLLKTAEVMHLVCFGMDGSSQEIRESMSDLMQREEEQTVFLSM